MDGVIVDNHIYHYNAWKAMAKNYDLDFNEEDYFNNMNGKEIGEVVRFLQNDASKQEVRKIGAEKEMDYRRLYQPYLTPTKGLLSFLSQANGCNIPMCIGTSASKVNVNFTINGLGISHYFKSILDDRSVKEGSPIPRSIKNVPNLSDYSTNNASYLKMLYQVSKQQKLQDQK